MYIKNISYYHIALILRLDFQRNFQTKNYEDIFGELIHPLLGYGNSDKLSRLIES